jgi:hypothetical protein
MVNGFILLTERENIHYISSDAVDIFPSLHLTIVVDVLPHRPVHVNCVVNQLPLARNFYPCPVLLFLCVTLSAKEPQHFLFMIIALTAGVAPFLSVEVLPL